MLLDTSGLFAFLDVRDHNHAAAATLLDAAPLRLTHSYVLAELVALAGARRLAQPVTLAFVETVADHADFEVVWVTELDHRAGMALLRDRPDKRYSLCDAISFILMRRRGLADALTTDHHFEQEGFARLLNP